MTNEFDMSKVLVLWVPCLLTADQKRTLQTMFAENLELFEADLEDIMT